MFPADQGNVSIENKLISHWVPRVTIRSVKLGIFDSGIGGEAVAGVLRHTFPSATILTISDSKNLPYGTKTQKEVQQLTAAAITPLLLEHCDVIVIACNTATALAIDFLRANYPRQKFIGIEPMIKSAVNLTTNRKIVVCATTATLSSKRYNDLKAKYATATSVIEPDCSDWATLIENNQLNRSHIESTIVSACDDGADVIVLGCTHYHWIKDLVVELAAGRAQVIEPSEAIGRRVKQLLELR